MLGKENVRFLAGLIAVLALFALTAAAKDLSLDELKARVESSPIAERPPLCIQIAERQLRAADKLYSADDLENARAAINDVASYSELARDYSIQSHKHQKQTEISVRKMARKLAEIQRSVSHEEQPTIQAAIDRLQRVRDDLLADMFPKRHS